MDRPLFRPKTNHTCHQNPNPSRETDSLSSRHFGTLSLHWLLCKCLEQDQLRNDWDQVYSYWIWVQEHVISGDCDSNLLHTTVTLVHLTDIWCLQLWPGAFDCDLVSMTDIWLLWLWSQIWCLWLISGYFDCDLGPLTYIWCLWRWSGAYDWYLVPGTRKWCPLHGQGSG